MSQANAVSIARAPARRLASARRAAWHLGAYRGRRRADAPAPAPACRSAPRLGGTVGFLVALGGLLCSFSSAATPTTSPALGAPATGGLVWSAQSAAEYLMLVQDLASPSMEGRGPGTAGIDKARDYIVRHFRDAGLEPAFDRGRSFTQSFELRGDMKVQKQDLSLRGPGGEVLYEAKPALDFSTLGLSPDANFRGQAVWVGYGVRNPQGGYDCYGDPNSRDLEGKVAIAFRYEPQDANGVSLWARPDVSLPPWSSTAGLANKAQWAADHGAVALLVVNPPSQDQYPRLRGADETGTRPGAGIPVVHISAEMFRHVLRAAGRDANGAALDELQRQADQGATRPQPLPGANVQGLVSLTATTLAAQNVAGLLRGAGELADQVLVIGAHYDHLGRGPFGSRTGERAIHPGADDNASGSSGVMMLAQWFARRSARSDAPGSRRSILFVTFSGEERGLIGSGYLVRNLSQAGLQGPQVVAMLNLDMIGRLREHRLQVMGADSGAEWRGLLKSASEATNLEVLPSGGGLDGSDHGSFYTVLKVPVLHFFTGLHGEYHTPKDTADRINAPGAIEVVRFAETVAEDLWTRPARPTYVAPGPGASPGGRGPSAYLGIALGDSAAAGKGVGIFSVLPGSPAEESGLRAGDVLLRLNDTPIDTLKDLLEALGAGQPGDKARLTIQRGGKTVEVEAKLGNRG
jgi:hypothetical protein